MTTEWVAPGTRLGHVQDVTPGAGTFVRGPHVYASVVGEKTIDGTTVEVRRDVAGRMVPEKGYIVAAVITKVNPRFASCRILTIGPTPLKESFNGVIRLQDVRATETDKVEIYKSFRPGDIISAEVVSLGDARSYYLSTAKNELGVIRALSVAGEPMVPVSWTAMECPRTGVREARKVAKV